MKYTPRQYANALLLATQGKTQQEQAQVLTRFWTILRNNKAAKLLPKILASYERLHRASTGKEYVAITTAQKLPEGALLSALEHTLGKQIEYSMAVDPSLLGGAVLRIGDTQLDGSVRMALQRLTIHLQEQHP